MVVGRAEMSEDFKLMVQDGDAQAIMMIKEKLTRDMVSYMLEKKLVEFTQMEDNITGNKHVAIRAYLAPNDQVKILRMANKIL